mmetsp:Transcript_32414/g.73457  ORF Transcript_32414/g.73457 Transcript_32414/m.73457 type:complete len:104 (-) Transcript_32414:196-507(-)
MITSPSGPIMDLADAIAKKRPSSPFGAKLATHESWRGLHRHSPTVITTCHKQEPNTVGYSPTKIGDMAINHSPGIMTEKVSLDAVIIPIIGGLAQKFGDEVRS